MMPLPVPGRVVESHGPKSSSFETPASQAPQDEDFSKRLNMMASS
jgi:hypothetical protein